MIVVTTPLGTVGSEVVQLLLQHSSPLLFRLAARTPDKVRQHYGLEVLYVKFDFADQSTWDATLDGIRILFLVVPVPDRKIIRTQIKPFIDAAVRARCQHIVYLSVPGADQQKILPHYEVERHIEASGISYTLIRASYFMQNLCGKNSTHGVDIATRHEIFIPAGNGAISFIDTRDIAQVVIKICEQPERHRNKAYLLTGQVSLTLSEVAHIFSQVMGYSVHYARPSIPHFWIRMLRRGVPWGLIIFMTIEYTVIRLGKASFLTNEVQLLLGHPATPLLQFVEDNKERWITQTWV